VQAFAQSIVETVRHPLLVLDLGLRVRKANAAFRRTFAVAQAETEGRLVRELGGGQWDIPRLREVLEEVARGGRPFEDFEVRHDFPNVGVKVMVLDARRVTNDADGTPMVLLAIEDVTDSRRAWDALYRLNRELDDRVGERTAQLEAANRELEAFAYSVSHDLRAPLRALDGFSDELLRSYPGRVLDDRGQHYLRRLRSGTQRMGRLIDDMLQLSRINRGEMSRETVDLSALAGEVAAELAGGEPGRRVAFAIEPGLSAVGDGALLRVALVNLLGNAWKFTSKKPTATITVGREEHEGVPAFFVRDDGAGFDMAHSSKLFGAFQRLHGEREFPGNGVGLATVQRVVHRHGGRVWAEGSPGQGAAFHFTLPTEERA
jgi:PAS domain S-box-containing protein